ncbi:hypothetical protein ICJ04_16940 [Stenotrophomonas sp. 169]|uniref:hypothetical protein n=1 Tax=Stenotrophomonas sp. 169 TaxID=2770322 RepID=UPI0016628376|nr:hypothetical protein [Stenotrophomonas sp. 169]QNR97140.1 hypothetical protein ICJ04_16940 [Stenotrophomonas sp. 169]
MNFLRTPLIRPLVMAAAFGMAAPAAFAAPANEWNIDLKGRAKTDGEITLAVTPAGGEATNVAIPIPAATNHEAAAVMISNALSKEFGTGVYAIRTDGTDEVEMKAINGNRDFDVIVVRNTADGLAIKLDRD